MKQEQCLHLEERRHPVKKSLKKSLQLFQSSRTQDAVCEVEVSRLGAAMKAGEELCHQHDFHQQVSCGNRPDMKSGVSSIQDGDKARNIETCCFYFLFIYQAAECQGPTLAGGPSEDEASRWPWPGRRCSRLLHSSSDEAAVEVDGHEGEVRSW